MLRFKEFVAECGGNISMVSIEKEKVDLTKNSTRNEINQALAAELSRPFTNPYGGWMKVQKVLSFYSIHLPKVFLDDEVEGEEIIPIHQFGHVVGADLSGNITPPQQSPEAEYFLYYNFELDDSGFYKTEAVILDEQGINSILEDDSIEQE